jgi:hypothetical protein
MEFLDKLAQFFSQTGKGLSARKPSEVVNMCDINYTSFQRSMLSQVSEFLLYWEDEITEMKIHEVVEALSFHLNDDDGKVIEIMSPYV